MGDGRRGCSFFCSFLAGKGGSRRGEQAVHEKKQEGGGWEAGGTRRQLKREACTQGCQCTGTVLGVSAKARGSSSPGWGSPCTQPNSKVMAAKASSSASPTWRGGSPARCSCSSSDTCTTLQSGRLGDCWRLHAHSNSCHPTTQQPYPLYDLWPPAHLAAIQPVLD